MLTATIAFPSSIIFVLAMLFKFQYNLLTGPFINALIMGILVMIGGFFLLVNIPLQGFKRLISYLPWLLFLFGFLVLIFLPNLGLGTRLHFATNKENLEMVSQISRQANVFAISDMNSHHKSLNNTTLSNNYKYNTKRDIQRAFAEQIKKDSLDIDKVVKLRAGLESSSINSLYRTDTLLVLTADGFIDNEYGYIRAYSGKVELGQTVPPFYFRIVRLLDLGDGWYYYMST